MKTYILNMCLKRTIFSNLSLKLKKIRSLNNKNNVSPKKNIVLIPYNYQIIINLELIKQQTNTFPPYHFILKF